jgi:hypothetical protein
MRRLRKAVTGLLRHFRPLHLLLIGVVVVANFAGAFNSDNWPAPVIAGLITLGLVLNSSVILLNGGLMPARVVEVPIDSQNRYRPMDNQTRAWLLGDWIPFGKRLMSPGDVCLIAAMAFPFVFFAVRVLSPNQD